MHPRVLRIETGHSSVRDRENSWWSGVLDYEVYAHTPRWWRKLEETVRLDIILALHARRLAKHYDVIWADSERIGVPLSATMIPIPVIVVAQHMASRKKRTLLRLLNITKKWAGIGYLCDADRDFIMSYYGVSPDRLFCAAAPDLIRFSPAAPATDGPIVSLGVAKRDYSTLIRALSQLPDCETAIHISSRYGDSYAGTMPGIVPSWVRFEKAVSSEELVKCYQRARFVVVPLTETTQYAAGMSVVLEAGASAKAVIATKTLGMASYVIDGVTGILVPPYDAQAWRLAIHKLWSQPDVATEMGQAGRRLVETKFGPKATNRVIREFLQKVTAGQPGFSL